MIYRVRPPTYAERLNGLVNLYMTNPRKYQEWVDGLSTEDEA